ncbi:EamA domain-containing membrane protein RarD [Cribrihabitans marinus]|uniref:EamA domain-containing membrane protein RarD n=1 Tax=Cribrihabitans marinus TaxID=1227549 RepID=A0A1H7DGR7_9RHOB|nr:DMT family transporter [Cribrihabitans marinus]GGH39217.1 transporter RarD family, DMT superfamily protein [Cribrihabitans marinus]SEK00838.1 EamA domain-containing membrane protein RarD [Cribrihabitans marinus]
MPDSLTSHRPVLAVSLKLGALVLFTFMSALVKALSEDIPAGEAVFFRSFFAIPVILVWLVARGELRRGLVAKRPMGHFWRGVLGTTAMGLTFTGLGLLPLPEVTAIGYATPIFTLILAAIMLGERIRLIRIGAVAIGLLGVLIMLWPRLGSGTPATDAATLGALCILAATVARAFVQIHIRQLVQVDHAAAIVFYFSVTASLLALLTVFFGWVVPTPRQAIMLVATGLIGGVAQILVTSSYRFGQASMLAPYDYTSMLLAIAIGYVWFAELPTLVMLAGAGLVIAGNVLVIWREHQLGLERGKARAVTDPKS